GRRRRRGPGGRARRAVGAAFVGRGPRHAPVLSSTATGRGVLRRKEPAVPRPAAPSSTSGELTYLEMAFARVPMFSACSVDELVRIAQVAAVRDVAEGAEVVREGEPGDAFFVILRGGARISRGGSAVATLDAGDFFGE